MTVTELGCMGVKPNHNIMDDTTPEGEIITKAYKTVTEKPGGPQCAYWGLELEDPTKVWAFFDFESVEAHEKFAKAYGPEVLKDLPKILTHSEFMKHVSLASPSSLVLKSPLTEIMFVHFPADISPTGKDAAAAQLAQAIDKTFGKCSDVAAVGYGWSVESDFPVRGETQAGSALGVFIGWTSLEAQTAFRESKAYKEAENSIRAIDGFANLTAVRVSCRGFERKKE